MMFNECDIDAFFLEYDDARSGDFAPLRFLPKGKTVVLGLVSTKLGELETKDEIKRRIDEAAKYRRRSTSWPSARNAASPARSTGTTSPPSSRPTRSACASKWPRTSGATADRRRAGGMILAGPPKSGGTINGRTTFD